MPKLSNARNIVLASIRIPSQFTTGESSDDYYKYMIRAVNASSPTRYGVIIASWLKSAFLSPFLCHLWQVRFPRK